MAAIGELVRSTSGQWMGRAPPLLTQILDASVYNNPFGPAGLGDMTYGVSPAVTR